MEKHRSFRDVLSFWFLMYISVSYKRRAPEVPFARVSLFHKVIVSVCGFKSRISGLSATIL